MCRGLREREEWGWFVKALLATSPALQNMTFLSIPNCVSSLFLHTPCTSFWAVFSLSCLLLPPPFSICACLLWFTSLFSAPDFLHFFLLIRKIHFSYCLAQNWWLQSLAVTFIFIRFQNFWLVNLLCEIPEMQLFSHLTLASSLDFPFMKKMVLPSCHPDRIT